MSDRRTPLPIENCRSLFRFLCPKTWSQLERTDSFDVRHCAVCGKDVFYCDSLEAVEEHRKARHCICIEAGVAEENLGVFLGEPTSD